MSDPIAIAVTAQPSGLCLHWARWSPERMYVGTFVRWRDVRDADPAMNPPELRLRDGRTVFVSAVYRVELARALAEAGVAIGPRRDAWGHLLAPFLDADYALTREQVEQDLRAWGFVDHEVDQIRRRLRRRMSVLTAQTWEWQHYGQADAVLAWMNSRIPLRKALAWFTYRRFRRWTDLIADRPPALRTQH
jgi:hypothetical protein